MVLTVKKKNVIGEYEQDLKMNGVIKNHKANKGQLS